MDESMSLSKAIALRNKRLQCESMLECCECECCECSYNYSVYEYRQAEQFVWWLAERLLKTTTEVYPLKDGVEYGA